MKDSYAALEPQSILQALAKLLRHYREQVLRLHNSRSLKRSLEADLDWLDTILKLCNSYL